MKLWLTRDADGEFTHIWCGDIAPELNDGHWEGAGIEYSVSQTLYECEPGTCQRLYTEPEARKLIADAMASMLDIRSWKP